MKSIEPCLDIPLQPSKCHTVILSVLVVLSEAAFWVSGLVGVALYAVMVLVFLLGTAHAFHLSKYNHRRVLALRVREELLYILVADRWLPVELQEQRLLMPWLICLKIKPSVGKPINLVIFFDMTNRECFTALYTHRL